MPGFGFDIFVDPAVNFFVRRVIEHHRDIKQEINGVEETYQIDVTRTVTTFHDAGGGVFVPTSMKFRAVSGSSDRREMVCETSVTDLKVNEDLSPGALDFRFPEDALVIYSPPRRSRCKVNPRRPMLKLGSPPAPAPHRVFHKLFAIVAGAAVTGAAAFSGRVAHQFRKIFLDFGAELPALTRAILEAPFALYVAVGVILGALAAWPIWVAKSKSRCRSDRGENCVRSRRVVARTRSGGIASTGLWLPVKSHGRIRDISCDQTEASPLSWGIPAATCVTTP
jgi:hypothetical protein